MAHALAGGLFLCRRARAIRSGCCQRHWLYRAAAWTLPSMWFCYSPPAGGAASTVIAAMPRTCSLGLARAAASAKRCRAATAGPQAASNKPILRRGGNCGFLARWAAPIRGGDGYSGFTIAPAERGVHVTLSYNVGGCWQGGPRTIAPMVAKGAGRTTRSVQTSGGTAWARRISHRSLKLVNGKEG